MDILKKFRVVEDQVEENLSRNQKLAVTGLVVLGFILIIYWGVGMKNNIYKPLNYIDEKKVTQTEQTLTEEEKLRSQDTDKDALNDWDELYVYGTSPYLEDTDSDGAGDGVEIQNRQNPNCPLGQDCGQVAVDDVVNIPSDNISDNQIDSSAPLSLSKDQVDSNQADLNKVFSGQADPATLRKLLLESGVSKEALDQMTDEQLMQSYLTTLQSNLDSSVDE
jgi:hypothetical protein